MDKILDHARKLQIIPLLAGVGICYAAVFVALLVNLIMGLFHPSVDIVSHPELAGAPEHPVFRPLVGALVALVVMAAAGYAVGMLALVREVQHAAAAGIIFVVTYVPYLVDVTSSQGIDTWADWLVVVLTIPAAMWGASRFAMTQPTAPAP